jgi:hypothetical protein
LEGKPKEEIEEELEEELEEKLGEELGEELKEEDILSLLLSSTKSVFSVI